MLAVLSGSPTAKEALAQLSEWATADGGEVGADFCRFGRPKGYLALATSRLMDDLSIPLAVLCDTPYCS